MRILSIRHGNFPQVRMLHHRFREDIPALMVTLDVEDYNPPHSQDFFAIYRALTGVFPTLSQHQCCEEWENTPLFIQKTEGVSVKTVGEVADIAHLTEHLIVDLLVAITDAPLCSGITCGHQSPENRFDLFVECEHVNVGVFAAQFATYLIRRLFDRQMLSPRFAQVVEAAKLVFQYPDGSDPCQHIVKHLHYSPAVARLAATYIQSFGLLGESE